MFSIHNKMLLILDLDETLIETKYEKSNEPDLIWNDSLDSYYIYKRPGLDNFLKYVFKNFTVALWSAASDDYVQAIAQYLLPDGYQWHFIWSEKRCTLRQNNINEFFSERIVIKNLKKVWRQKKNGWTKFNTLIVDDTPTTYQLNYGNAIPINKFSISIRNDNELEYLQVLLNIIKDVPNVRNIEKRYY